MENGEVSSDRAARVSLAEQPVNKIRALIREELLHVLQQGNLSQEDLAIELRYADQSSISRILG